MADEIDTNDIDGAVAEVRGLPPGRPGRGVLAASLISIITTADPAAAPARLRHLGALVAIADADPPGTPGWPRLRSMALAMALMHAAAERELADPVKALADLDAMAKDADGDAPLMMLLESARAAVRFLQAFEAGDEAALRDVGRDVGRIRELAGDHPDVDSLAEVMSRAADLMTAHRTGGDAWAALERVREAADRLPPDHQLRVQLDEATSMLAAFQDQGDTPPAAHLATLTARADQPGITRAERAQRLAALGVALLRGGQETDPDRVAAGIVNLRGAVAQGGPDDPQRPFYLQGLALGLFRRNELTNHVADLDEAAVLLEEARELAGGPHHPQWMPINEMLAHARRRVHREPTDTGPLVLDGLRSHAWRVLIQTDLPARHLAAREAARDALDSARMLLVDGRVTDAIRALDAGRALALFAATGLRDVGDQLARAGQVGLAERWRAASDAGRVAELPVNLRQEVLTALSAPGTSTGLLDPPTLGEIRAALTTLDADALVYLMPGDPPAPGYAVIAPVQGPPSYLALPNLATGPGQDVDRYLTALARRDASLADPARDASPKAGTAFLDGLDALCDWAWDAAIGPLLDRYLPGLDRPATRRPPRIVLVPIGELARVPWQAARDGHGRYAIERAAFSQAASARMLCRSAALPRVPLLPIGMVVGDPDSHGTAAELAAARIEAFAVHRSFYCGGRYLGRRADGTASPSGAGTADEVRAWLRSTGPAAGAVLHLACHGVVEPDRGAMTSYLLLAGGDRLTASELTDVMASAPRRAVALVVLAACRSGQAITSYDEAYSLGTAFLAGGARSVLSTQWSIPDRATSVLMYMFHRHLSVDRLPAWEALHRAQRWMLDPRRLLPEGMPAKLRDQLADDLDRVDAWAGFVHWGQ